LPGIGERTVWQPTRIAPAGARTISGDARVDGDGGDSIVTRPAAEDEQGAQEEDRERKEQLGAHRGLAK
jgi:hypothetical protein